jgi:EmrB/QacA subfamily drug resistance transporter
MEQPTGGLSHRQILTILGGLMLGMFLAALDQTIVSTAMPRIANDLNGLNIQAWVTTAYLITSTITTPLYGKLSDLYGRKPFYLIAISVFVVGSAACTFATSMYELAAFRAFQGIGAGGLMSLAFTIMGDIIPPRERARYQAYFLGVFGGTSVLGPVVGGALSGANSILGVTGWRWVFLVNVPIGIIALFVIARVLNLPHQRRDQRVDWWGALTLVIGVVPVLIVAEQGQSWGWGATGSILCYVVAGVGIGLFILIEALMKDAALIPLRLFRNRVFATVIMAGVIVGAAMFGGITLIPQYLQIVKGFSPTVSGLAMLPMMVGLMGASVMSGQITSRTGRYKAFPIIGSVFIVGASLLFTTITVDSPMWQIMIYMFLFGFGVGNCMQTLTLAAQNAADPKDMGVSTAAATFFRQMGGTLGVAVFLSILFSTVGGKIGDALKSALGTSSFRDAAAQAGSQVANHTANSATQQVVAMLHGGGAGTSTLSNASFFHQISQALARPFEIGFTNSIALVYWSIAGLGVIAVLITLFIKEIPLRATAAISAAVEGAEGPLTPVVEPATLDAELAEITAGQKLVSAGRHALSTQDTEILPRNGADHNGSAYNGNGFSGASLTGADFNGGGPREAAETGTPISGQVRRTDRTPVAGAVLTLINHSGKQVARGTSGPDGGYRVTAPLDGVYVLIASCAGHQPQATTLRVAGAGVTTDVLMNGTARATGVVRTIDGQPVAAATVTITDTRGEVVGAGTSGPDGRYRFGELLGGSYTLVVSAAGHQPYATTLTVPDTGDAMVDVQLSGAARISGVARVGADDGRPVFDARVTLVDAGGNVVAMTSTDESGGYTFTDMPDGEYTVIASGYPPVTSHPRVAAGEEQVHNVVLGHTDL